MRNKKLDLLEGFSTKNYTVMVEDREIHIPLDLILDLITADETLIEQNMVELNQFITQINVIMTYYQELSTDCSDELKDFEASMSKALIPMTYTDYYAHINKNLPDDQKKVLTLSTTESKKSLSAEYRKAIVRLHPEYKLRAVNCKNAENIFNRLKNTHSESIRGLELMRSLNANNRKNM